MQTRHLCICLLYHIQVFQSPSIIIIIIWGKRADSKADQAQTITNCKCCAIKSETVVKVFSSINCGGSEFHSWIILGK